MAIKLTDKIHIVSTNIDTKNRGSAQANAGRDAYTLQEVSTLIGGGGGGGTIGGSITDNQVAIGATTADSIEGSASLTYDGSLLTVSGGVSSGTLTATTDIDTPTLSVTGGVVGSLRSAFVAAAPTDAATAGTQGDILFDAVAIYVCTVTGVVGAATWKRVVLVDLV